ncbi:hypothetical protein ACOMHN_016778 [Nucella lapillus]
MSLLKMLTATPQKTQNSLTTQRVYYIHPGQGTPLSVHQMGELNRGGFSGTVKRMCVFLVENDLATRILKHWMLIRKKSGPGIKRNCELDKEHPVTKHIQQLKKKKVAYFCQDEEGALKKSPQTTTAATSASGVIDAQTPVTPPPLVSPRPAAAAKRSPDRGLAAVPPTVVPVTEDDDDSRWFRSHWGSQLLAKSFRSFEE